MKITAAAHECWLTQREPASCALADGAARRQSSSDKQRGVNIV